MAAATTEEVLVSELSQLDITTTTSSSSPPRSSPLPRDSTPALSSRTSTPSSNKRFGSFSPLHPPISPIVELHSRELARKLQRRLEQNSGVQSPQSTRSLSTPTLRPVSFSPPVSNGIQTRRLHSSASTMPNSRGSTPTSTKKGRGGARAGANGTPTARSNGTGTRRAGTPGSTYSTPERTPPRSTPGRTPCSATRHSRPSSVRSFPPRSSPSLSSGGSSSSGFESYMTLEDVQSSLRKGELVEGVLRINPKRHEDAYISAPDGAADIFICGLRERNRALNGDLVAVQLLPPDKWVASTERILSSLSSMSQEDFDVVLYAARTSAAKEELIRLRQSAASEVVAPPAQGGDPTSAATPGSGLEDPAVSEGGQAPVSEHPTGPGKAPVDKRMKKPKEKAAVVVPPDELSECEDDDEFEDGSSDVGVVEDDIEDKEQMQKDVAPLVDVFSAEPSLLPVEEEAKLELQMVSQSLKLLPPDFHSDEELEDEDGVPPPMDYYSAVTHPLLPPSPGSPPDQSGSSVASHDVASDSVPSALSVMKTSSASVVSKPDEELCENVPSCDAASSPVKEPPTQSEKKVVIQFGQKTQKAAQKKGQKIKAKISFPSAPTTVSSSSLPPRGAVGGGPRTYDDPMVDSPLLEGIRNLTIERLQEKYNKLDPLDKVSVVELLKLSAWKKYVQRRAKVVFILEARNPRCVAGTLKLFKDGNPTVALFSPRDARFPRLRIPMGECPPDLTVTPEKYQHTLFMALLIHWEDVGFAEGSLIRCLGDAGQIGPETDAILVAHGVETGEFSPEAMACLPKVDAVDGSWKIPEEEIRQREDFRDELIFTIDPETARDLDDALCCQLMDDGTYEVGVHIADVSYFVEEGCALDREALRRATSVYMVQMVVPMLPRLLCEKLCSLNPGEDRLAFSTRFTFSPAGDLLAQRFATSVIRSRAKLSYEVAQRILETDDLPHSLFPSIEDPALIPHITRSIRHLFYLSQKLREKRIVNGALRLDQVKLCFQLDPETKMPMGFSAYQLRDSNRLIEEFMLLANISVAVKLFRTYPTLAFLRRHPEPHETQLDAAVSALRSFGIIIDTSSSKTIADSLAKYVSDDDLSSARLCVLTNMISKPMQLAKYFCAGVCPDPGFFRHYALSVPLYTHFTSPIRRYPDVIVHRMLKAAIGKGAVTAKQGWELQSIAEHCNLRKEYAKKCSELSSEMFLGCFISACGPLRSKGMIMGVLDHAFEVLLLDMGSVCRVYTNTPNIASYNHVKLKGVSSIRIHWAADPFDIPPPVRYANEVKKSSATPKKQEDLQKKPAVSTKYPPETYTMFSIVRLHLQGIHKTTRFTAVLIPSPTATVLAGGDTDHE